MRLSESEEVLGTVLNTASVSAAPGSREELTACIHIAHLLASQMDKTGAQLPLKILDAIWSCAMSFRWGFTSDPNESTWQDAMGAVVYLFEEVTARIYGFSRSDFPAPLEENEVTGDLAVYLRPLFDVGRYPVVGGFGDRYRLSFRPDNYEPQLVTLEHALNRVLRPPFRTLAIGGPYDAFGMARGYFSGNWRDLVSQILPDEKPGSDSNYETYSPPFAVQKVQKLNFRGGLSFGSAVL